MAARRVARSAVDWTAFTERIPANQKDAFRAFKARSDFFLSRVFRYPETPAAIDFAAYRRRLASPALVDKFEKEYKAIKVPYPSDVADVKSSIAKEEAAVGERFKAEKVQVDQMIADAKSLLAKIDSLPKPEEMTHEMYAEYFPHLARNPQERPTFWPHTKDQQPENDKHLIN